MSNGVSLKVAEPTQQKDIGFNYARVPAESLARLHAEPGDFVEIVGPKRSTAAILKVIHEEAPPHNVVRLEAILRRNAGVSIGDRVTVRKVECHAAERLVIAPISEESTQINLGPEIEDFLVKALSMTRKPLAQGDLFVVPGVSYRGGLFPFTVVSTGPRGFITVTAQTMLAIRPETVSEREVLAPRISYEDIGGLKEKLGRIREMIELPLKHPELFDRLAITPPKGVLLYGPPGSGKTLIARAVASEAGAYFLSIAGPEIMSKYYGESEKVLRDRFEDAEKNAPSVIFIDELDSIAPRRDDVTGEVERRVVAQLLTSMDGLSGRGRVIVIGATNREDAIDPALRRPGRFDREIEIGVPTKDGRREILQIHTRGMPIEGTDKERDDLLSELAGITYGFVGADLAALSREAAMHALRRYLPDMDFERPISVAFLERMKVTREDFREALRTIEPSSLRDVTVEVPSVHWNEVGGMEELKRTLKESVETPFTNPERYRSLGISAPRGVLLYGPPGTGKTLLAKAVATESQANFISIKGPELMSRWVGETERAIRLIFKKARAAAPAIIFIDEIDSLAPKRGLGGGGVATTDSTVNQLLTALDGLESLEGVMVIAATNRPDILDDALLRTGRFDRLIYFPPPDLKARLEILRIHTRGMSLEGVSVEALAEQTEGFVGSDLAALCKEAAIQALRQDATARRVGPLHFERALQNIHSSVSREVLSFYEEFGKALTVSEKVRKGKRPFQDGLYR